MQTPSKNKQKVFENSLEASDIDGLNKLVGQWDLWNDFETIFKDLSRTNLF